MPLYGLGYGLGKMGEGLSSGLLQGTMTGLTLEMQKRKEEQALRIAASKEAGLERRHGETLAETTRAHKATEMTNVDKAKWQKVGAALKSANEVLQYTEDGDAATKVLGAFYGANEENPISGIQLDPKTKEIKIDTGDGTFIIKDKKYLSDLADIFTNNPESSHEAIQEAMKAGIGSFIPKAGAPMTEAQKLEYGKGGFKEQEIGLKKREVGIKEKAETRKATEEKKRTFKDKALENIWGTLTNDEKKKALGAGIDPHDLTEKNILDVYGNIMTDPTVKKALQPIAEQIMKKAIEKGGIGKELDEATAKQILIEAGGDKEKARKLAKDRGYKF